VQGLLRNVHTAQGGGQVGAVGEGGLEEGVGVEGALAVVQRALWLVEGLGMVCACPNVQGGVGVVEFGLGLQAFVVCQSGFELGLYGVQLAYFA